MTEPPIPPGAPDPARARAVVLGLERSGVRCALGGSGLLAALGLAATMRDWDVTTDAPLEAILAAIEDRPAEHHGNDALHADEKLTLAAEGVEIIRRFAFFTPGGVVRLPTFVTGRWHGIPIGAAECWAIAYDLLERPAKRDLLLGWLARHGADGARLDGLLAQPLPEPIAARLRALPRS